MPTAVKKYVAEQPQKARWRTRCEGPTFSTTSATAPALTSPEPTASRCHGNRTSGTPAAAMRRREPGTRRASRTRRSEPATAGARRTYPTPSAANTIDIAVGSRRPNQRPSNSALATLPRHAPPRPAAYRMKLNCHSVCASAATKTAAKQQEAKAIDRARARSDRTIVRRMARQGQTTTPPANRSNDLGTIKAERRRDRQQEDRKGLVAAAAEHGSTKQMPSTVSAVRLASTHSRPHAGARRTSRLLSIIAARFR